MGRPKSREYDRDALETEILRAVVELYNDPDNPNHDISYIAAELGMTGLKVRKLLITAGDRDGHQYYTSSTAAQIQKLFRAGKTIKEIEELTGLSHTSVVGYLPYSKTMYGMKEISVDAERIRRFRERQRMCREYMSAVAGLSREEEESQLWKTIGSLAGCQFRTSGRGKIEGLKFKYSIRGGEMFIDRKEKSLTRATILMAYWRARELNGQVKGPKTLGTFGASYLYPVFLRIGVIKKDEQLPML